MKKAWAIFVCAVLLLIAAEILKVYFIMPFPGSQLQNNVELAYNLNKYIWVARLVCGSLLLYSLIGIFKASGIALKILAVIFICLLAGVFYLTNYVMLADKIFYQPSQVLLLPVGVNNVDSNRLVLGIEQNGDARAYPINIIGYHHQVRDTVSGTPVMVTYCTVCRTGRVFRPLVDGKPESFRLVGMDQFNAMFEDATTHSWWRQATGECCAGPLKGQKLPEIASQQMTLASWTQLYPNAKVLQPDPKYASHYHSLKGYDDGTSHSSLTGTDTTSGHIKSWVVVIANKQSEKMYDWNQLKKQRVINDSVGHEPVLLTMDGNMNSFYALNRQINGVRLSFTFDSKTNNMVDDVTSSIWNLNGDCIDGAMKGTRMKYVKAYQEFMHSYLSFPVAKIEAPFK